MGFAGAGDDAEVGLTGAIVEEGCDCADFGYFVRMEVIITMHITRKTITAHRITAETWKGDIGHCSDGASSSSVSGFTGNA